MTTCSYLLSSHMISIFLLVLFTTPSSADLFNDVCSGTLKPTICSTVIKSIPGAAKATDFKSLGQTVIPYAISNGATTATFIKSLASVATDIKLKEDYTSCSENYNDAVSNLEEAQDFYKKGDFSSVGFRASAGMSAVDDCEDGFKDLPVKDPSELPSKNEYFKTLCVIILRIANKLRG